MKTLQITNSAVLQVEEPRQVKGEEILVEQACCGTVQQVFFCRCEGRCTRLSMLGSIG